MPCSRPVAARISGAARGLLVVAATAGLIYAFGLLGRALPGRLPEHPGASFGLLGLFAAVELLVVLGMLRLLEGGRGNSPLPRRAGFRRWTLRGLGIGIVAAGWGPAAACLCGDGWLLPMPPAEPAVRLAALAVVPLSAFWEETIYRGTLLPRLRPMGIFFALTVSALAFAGLHFLAEPLYVERALLLVGFGLVLGIAFLASGNLWFPIGIHLGINLVAYLASSDPSSGGIWRLVVVMPRALFAVLALPGLVFAGIFAHALPRALRRSSSSRPSSAAVTPCH